MAVTSVTYTGDAIERSFTVPFPYIVNTHVKVYVNETLRLDPSDYYFLSSTVVRFATAPGIGDSVRIKRVTPGDTRLVDFTNGAVLSESDLDLSANQNFYLTQEAIENYAELLTNELVRLGTPNGILDTDPVLWFDAAVDTMLATQGAADLQQGLTDIATNGEGLLDHTDILQLIGDADGGRTAFILDNDTIQVGGGVTLAERWAALVAVDGDNAAAIVTEQTVRANADSAIASDITLLGAANGGDTAFIIETSTVKVDSDGGDTFETALARNAVALDVNGYVTGYEQINDGTSGSFGILADKFLVAYPSTVWEASTAYTVGQFVRPTAPTTPNRVFKCTTAGTSGGTEPTWNTTVDGTTNDNTAVWTTKADSALAPFTIEDGVILMNSNVAINGDLLVTGSILTAALEDNAVTATAADTSYSNKVCLATSWTTVGTFSVDIADTDIMDITANFAFVAGSDDSFFNVVLKEKATAFTAPTQGAAIGQQHAMETWGSTLGSGHGHSVTMIRQFLPVSTGTRYFGIMVYNGGSTSITLSNVRHGYKRFKK